MKTRLLLYCTKGKPMLEAYKRNDGKYHLLSKLYDKKWCDEYHCKTFNGKIVAECECDIVWKAFDSNSGIWDPSKSNEENQKTWHHHYELGFVSHKYLYKVEPYLDDNPNCYSEEYGSLLEKSCLTQKQIFDYLNEDKNVMRGKNGYALHLTNIKAFEKPLELKEVDKLDKGKCESAYIPLTKAPQNMCWVWYKGQKYVLISIRPEWLCKILNGEKTIEVRRKILKGMM